MTSNLGLALLLLVFSLGVFLPIFTIIYRKKIAPAELEKISLALSATIFAAALLTQACLIYAFVISDYSIANVYKNSHHLKPLIYKISGSWGNHEGSMLLLICTLCAYSFAFNFFSKIRAEIKLTASACQFAIIALFAAYTAFSSNPFERIFPTPTSGLGLNPLLQDIGLALHPPMLYTGYIGFSLIFSLALAALICEEFEQKFVRQLKSWLFFSYAFLTAGIGLGAWWAYRELGWGGYWFWDPVENISLMPWIAATALIHALRLFEKKGSNPAWSIFLAILTFILCLLGIFLTRSGVLSSVHSFAVDAKRGFFIITLILLIGAYALTIFGLKIDSLKTKKIVQKTKQETLILLNNYFLLVALFIVLLGTLYPIFARSFFNEFVTIGADYYNKIFSILIIPFLIFLAIGTFGKNISRHVFCAHFGFFLIIAGITLSSFFGQVKEVNLRQGQVVKIGSHEAKFINVEHLAGKNFLARQGNFEVTKNGKKIAQLTPQLRYYPESDQTTNEAAIHHGILGDFYLVIGTKDEQENYAVRAYFKPFIWLIWLGCALIFTSCIFHLGQAYWRKFLTETRRL